MGLISPFRYLASALVAEDSPRRLAAGFALGMVAGLIPKSSLFSHLALLVVCLVQVNLASGYLSALVFSLISPALDPLTHPIGRLLLVKAGFLTPLWTRLSELPVVPWTRFNNTVVLGSAVLAAALAYPAYRLAIPFFERYKDRIGAHLKKYRLAKILLGADIGTKLAGR